FVPKQAQQYGVWRTFVFGVILEDRPLKELAEIAPANDRAAYRVAEASEPSLSLPVRGEFGRDGLPGFCEIRLSASCKFCRGQWIRDGVAVGKLLIYLKCQLMYPHLAAR